MGTCPNPCEGLELFWPVTATRLAKLSVTENMKRDMFSELAFGDPALFVSRLGDVDINITHTDGANLLQTALAFRHHDIARMLVERGIDVNHVDEDGRTPLHYAAVYHALGVAERILQAGGDLSIADSHGNTPLWTAVHALDHDMIRLFMAHGADPDRKNNYGRSPLDFARQMNVPTLVELLTKRDRSEPS